MQPLRCAIVERSGGMSRIVEERDDMGRADLPPQRRQVREVCNDDLSDGPAFDLGDAANAARTNAARPAHRHHITATTGIRLDDQH